MALIESNSRTFQSQALPSDVWKDRLREKATIRRGSEVVSFFVGGHTYSGKHRVSVYKYPESNKVSYHRIGDDSTTVTLPGWIVSEDIEMSVNGINQPVMAYHDVRDRLRAILQKGGVVTLEHPYLGTMLLMIDSFTVTEKVGQFAYADVAITGFRVDKRNFREDYSATDASLVINEMVIAVEKAVSFSVENGVQELQKVGGDPNRAPTTPGWVQRLDNRIDGIDNVVAGIEQVVVSPIKKAQAVLQGTIDRIRKLRQTGQRLYVAKKGMSRLQSLSIGLFYDSTALYNTIVGAMTPGFNPFGDIPLSPTEQQKIIKEYAVSIPEESLPKAFDLSFEGVINRTVASQCVMVSCAMAANASYQSQQDIEDTRDAIVRLTDSYLSYDAVTYEEREAIMGLKSATITALYSANTLSVRKITPESPETLINLLYKETGGVSQLAETAIRNNIRDPFSIATEVVL